MGRPNSFLIREPHIQRPSGRLALIVSCSNDEGMKAAKVEIHLYKQFQCTVYVASWREGVTLFLFKETLVLPPHYSHLVIQLTPAVIITCVPSDIWICLFCLTVLVI